jgi:hypothetical protein
MSLTQNSPKMSYSTQTRKSAKKSYSPQFSDSKLTNVLSLSYLNDFVTSIRTKKPLSRNKLISNILNDSFSIIELKVKIKEIFLITKN